MDSTRNCFVCKRTFQVLTSLKNDYDESSKKSNQEQFKIFYSFVCRYLNFDINLVDSFSSTGNNPKRTLKPSESNLIDDSLSCCDICVPLMKSFCDTYNQWKILQLVLNWKLETITKLMSLKAGNHDNSERLGRKGEMFRKVLLEKVEDKSIQFPRLKLEKLEVRDSTIIAPLGPDPLGTPENPDCVNDDIVSALTGDDEPEFDTTNYHIDIKEENVLKSETVNQDDHARKDKRKQLLISKVDTTSDFDGDGKNECNICGKILAPRTDLTEHLRTHSGEKPYSCEHCKKRFCSRSNLKRHVALHGTTKFKCRYCKATFTSKYYLNFHESVHLGKAKFQCRFCGHGFSSTGKRNDHENTHTGKKPHKCRHCTKAFANKWALLVHERSHTPEFKNVTSVATGSLLCTPEQNLYENRPSNCWQHPTKL